MTVYEKLLNVQSVLKAPKGQFNDFGKYRYRSCEDILEALKPVLKDHKATVFITDDVVNVANRVYVKATATFVDIENGEKVVNTAFAREADTKKGQDDSQITGTASSYARKYALNGLFLIDDTKDTDTNEYHEQTNRPKLSKQEAGLNSITKPVRFTADGQHCEIRANNTWHDVNSLKDAQIKWALNNAEYAAAHDALKAVLNSRNVK